MQQDILGVIQKTGKRSDYLFRISVKGMILNDEGKVLVVKETGRGSWDLPGGGMDHGETIKDALARELHEEVGLKGDFDYQVIAIEDPNLLLSNMLQIRVIFRVIPEINEFFAGIDGDEITFIDTHEFANSKDFSERKVYEYTQLAVVQKETL